jgi:hypothetical protein
LVVGRRQAAGDRRLQMNPFQVSRFKFQERAKAKNTFQVSRFKFQEEAKAKSTFQVSRFKKKQERPSMNQSKTQNKGWMGRNELLASGRV